MSRLYSTLITFNAKRITVLHDSLFWDQKNNYSVLWRKYFISLINLGLNKGTQIITTSNYSKKNLIKILGNHRSINFVYQSFNFPKLHLLIIKHLKITYYTSVRLKKEKI